MKGISIIVSFYKGEKFIDNLIESLLFSYSLSQKRFKVELIVRIDSMENSEKIKTYLLKKYEKDINIRVYINSSNIGVAASRNLGITNSSFDFFTIIDQDDLVTEDYFAVLEQNLDESKALLILNGYFDFVGKSKMIKIFHFPPKFNLFNIARQRTIIYTPGLLIFNKKFINYTDFFIETSKKSKGSDDWAAYINLILLTRNQLSYKFVLTPIFRYCLHSTNFSNDKEQMLNSSISVLDHFLQTLNSESYEYKVINSAKKRYSFLATLKTSKNSLLSIFFSNKYEFLDHFLLSFLSRDRLNRLIFRACKKSLNL